jgi:hypothetical protein
MAVEYRLGETAPDVSFGDTAVEYLLAEAAEDLSFGAGSEARRGVMCVMVSFCSNGLATVEKQGSTQKHRLFRTLSFQKLECCVLLVLLLIMTAYLPGSRFRLRKIHRLG